MENLDFLQINVITDYISESAEHLNCFKDNILSEPGFEALEKLDPSVFGEIIDKVNSEINKLYSINSIINDMVASMSGNIDNANQSANGIDSGDVDFDTEMVSNRPSYSTYVSYQFFGEWQLYNTNVFRSVYNDLPDFLSSADHEFYDRFNAASQISDPVLYFDALFNDGDYYIQKRIKSALQTLLEQVPSPPKQESFLDIVGEIEKNLGVDESKHFYEELYKFLKSSNKTGMKYIDDWFKIYVKENNLSQDQIDVLGDIIKNTEFNFLPELFSKSDKLFKGLDTVNDIYNTMKTAVEVAEKLNADYTNQLEYLKTLKNAIANAGYYNDGSPLVRALEDIEERYKNRYYDVAEDIFDEVIKNSGKVAVSQLLKHAPSLGLADLVLGTVAQGANVIAGDEISALQKVEGMQIYDNVLTESYNKYLDLMRQGRATNEDMENADRLLELVIDNKISIYEAMLEVSKNEEYSHKLSELRQMQRMMRNPEDLERERRRIMKEADEYDGRVLHNEELNNVLEDQLNAQFKPRI